VESAVLPRHKRWSHSDATLGIIFFCMVNHQWNIQGGVRMTLKSMASTAPATQEGDQPRPEVARGVHAGLRGPQPSAVFKR
jgi:hypothetical protein